MRRDLTEKLNSDVDEIYNDFIEDFTGCHNRGEGNFGHSSQGSHGIKSKGSLTNEQLMASNGIVPSHLRKIRVESFAKTPFFIKSPRSIASS